MGNEGWTDNTKIEVNNEDIHISGKLSSSYEFRSGGENRPDDDDPDNDDDALDNKCRNGSFEKGVLRYPPELEMPAVSERPEDERRSHRCKREGWAQAKTQTPLPKDIS